MDQMREYLEFVLDWSDPNTFKCISVPGKNPGQFYNRPVQTIEKAIKECNKANQGQLDCYVALATFHAIEQRAVAGSNRTWPALPRTHSNVATLMTLFLDIDVGKKNADGTPKGYQTQNEAINDLNRWCAAVNMPQPSLYVESGSGGIHVYWRLDKPATLAEWQALANALKGAAKTHNLQCDLQVIEAARILRVPLTFNWKDRANPKPVVMSKPGPSYSYSVLYDALHKAAGVHLAHSQPTPQAAPRAGVNQNFTANVSQQAQPRDLMALADECGVLADAIDNGGAGMSQPLWHLLALASTWDIDPKGILHQMSEKWVRADGLKQYDPVDTDNKLKEKVLLRMRPGGIGFPQCAQFAAEHKACASCKHLAAGKSPLNIVIVPAQPQPSVAAFAASSDLPNGYWREVPSLRVFGRIGEDRKGNEITGEVMPYAVGRGWTDVDDNLIFEAMISKQRGIEYMQVSTMDVSSRAIANILGRQHIVFNSESRHAPARDFLMAWKAKILEDGNKPIELSNIGWNADKTTFTYGKHTYTAKGVTPALYRDAQAAHNYQPHGQLAVWQGLVTRINISPAFTTLLSVAFAAPLVGLCSSGSVALAVIGESGEGKTTALRCSTAAWLHPKLGMNSLDDTVALFNKKAETLGSIMMVWDELRTEIDNDKFANLFFRLTQGMSRQTLQADRKISYAGGFSTMMVVASNNSVLEYVIANTKGTAAGAARIFEIKMPKATWAPTLASQIEFEATKLESNFGRAGEIYAQHLVTNRESIEKSVVAVRKLIESDPEYQVEDRFWATTIACLVVGALEATKAGICQLDHNAVFTFLNGQMKDLRETKRDQVQTSTATDIETLIGDLINDGINRFLIRSNHIWRQPGPVPMGFPQPGADFVDDRISDPWAHYARHDNVLRVSKHKFRDWLQKRGYMYSKVFPALKAHPNYKVTEYAKMSLGAGTKWHQGAARSAGFDIDFISHTSVP